MLVSSDSTSAAPTATGLGSSAPKWSCPICNDAQEDITFVISLQILKFSVRGEHNFLHYMMLSARQSPHARRQEGREPGHQAKHSPHQPLVRYITSITALLCSCGELFATAYVPLHTAH
uniref:Uncharacterized protein n=1 Tax=Amazona collaria TaxID=241587 RepID=A0A8B9IW57_9PSIT